MGVRLNKVLTELNIGLQTAVDYLKNKKSLGEIKDDANMNTKINDEQYEALVKEFRGDKDVKTQAGMMFPKKKEKEKVKKEPKPEPVVIEVKEEPRQTFTPLGKIDLSQVGKPAPKEKAEPKPEPKPVEKPEPKPVEKAEEKVDHTTPNPSYSGGEKAEPKPEPVPTPKQETKPEPKPADAEPQVSAPKEQEVYKLKTEQKAMPNLNVVGKIDLDSLNQSTRPKKKSKEERKKEREEKQAQLHGGNGEKKKRERIRGGKERVDIEAAANQDKGQNQNNKKNKNKGGNQNFQDGGQQGGKNKKKNRPVKPLEVDDEAVARQVKETLARLTSKNQNKKGAKYRREKRDAVAERMNEEMAQEAAQSKVLKLTEFVTVSELATMMNVGVNQVIGTCMSIGIMVSINQRLDAETIKLIADEFGFEISFASEDVVNTINKIEEEDKPEDLVVRNPIITVMGHVDHGKTSLLDYIRKTNVIAGEAGGITQHIGAYEVQTADGRKITFLDTPGHEAFTAMRARGAKMTDIAIIVIAADDKIMPQTVEAINHAQSAGVPIVFAINKIDKPGADPDRIKTELANMNLLVEEWGGKYQSQDISAKKGIGVEELLEKVILQADIMELKGNPNKRAKGTVIESTLDKGRGYVAKLLVEDGTIRKGDPVVAGATYGRVRAMYNERNQEVMSAGPSQPVLLLGLTGACQAGDTFNVMENEKEAKDIAAKRTQLQREQGIRTQTHLTLEEIGRRRALGNFKELNIIVKGDVDGSVEALSDSLLKLSNEEVQVNVIHKAVGQISENDVMLAMTADAIIIGFQVRPSIGARKMAETEHIDIRLYSIIYDAINELKDAIEGMLAPETQEKVTCNLEIRETFKISKVGTIAGCMCLDGKINRNTSVRIIRDGIVVYTGKLSSLKRFKDDVKEVVSGQDCGLGIENFNDLKVGDIVEGYEIIEIKRKL